SRAVVADRHTRRRVLLLRRLHPQAAGRYRGIRAEQWPDESGRHSRACARGHVSRGGGGGSMKGTAAYPAGWPDFARALKDACGWACIRCGHPHDPKAGYCLTVHHLTMDKAEPFAHWWAFLPLCQRCHLKIQHKVVLDRPWVFGHSAWFK